MYHPLSPNLRIGIRLFMEYHKLFLDELLHLSFSEGIYQFTLYLQDRIGNNQTYRRIYHIDDTPVSNPESSVSSGSWKSDDTEFIRYYFDEQPQLVLANWNDDNNETLRIQFEALMTFKIDQTNGRYFVSVIIPKNNVLHDFSLELFVQDRANNWIKFEYSYYKVPTAQDMTPYLLLIILLLMLTIVAKRKFLREKFNIAKDKLFKDKEKLPDEDTVVYKRQKEKSKKNNKMFSF
jgi:hypothetical protein